MGVEAVNFVTFITPTLGRPTLARTFKSLEAQRDWDWKWFVVWDGIEPNQKFNTDRQFDVVTPKLSHAGLVRNVGIEKVTTQWMAFIDDDDWISDIYVNRLKHYSSNLDVVIFTYRDVKTGNTQPPQNFTDIVSCNVGISFACRTDFIKENNIRFTPYSIEDFRFLDDCRRAGARYKLTHEILYWVGGISGWV